MIIRSLTVLALSLISFSACNNPNKSEENVGSEVLQGGSGSRIFICDSTKDRGDHEVTYQVKFRYSSDKNAVTAAKVQASGRHKDPVHNGRRCTANCESWSSNVELKKENGSWLGFRSDNTKVFRLEGDALTQYAAKAKKSTSQIDLTHFAQSGEGIEPLSIAIAPSSCRTGLIW